MWLAPVSGWILSAALLGQTTAAVPPAALPELIATKEPVFAIPFRVDRIDNPTRQPTEVQLLVSSDRGARWQMYAKAPPSQQQFLFRANGDAEYWFAIRTIDRSGQVRPERITAPALRVLVDTKRPALKEVKAERDVGPSITSTTEPRGSVAVAINPAIGDRFPALGKTTDNAETSGLPPGERPRMVNSRLFELEYDIDSIGPSGIGRVELWGTRDGGRTWRSFAVDQDKRSPILVNVDEEGVYGFRVVVSNGAGFGGKPPQSGDLPDLWVGVDIAKPVARIISAEQGTDAEAGYLIITWQADDRMLAARPISLSFSQSRTGPWLPVAAGLDNNGRYAWPLDSRISSQFYLRLEVRDEAGNIGVHQTSEPITIDQSRPTIRVRDIRAVGPTAARPAGRF